MIVRKINWSKYLLGIVASCSLFITGVGLVETCFARQEETTSTEKSSSQSIGSRIQKLLDDALKTRKSLAMILFLAFLAGVLTSFTPCVYPMIPITIGILQTQVQSSVWRNFVATLFYVIGIALVYAGLGYVSATSALFFGQWLASPWFLLLIVIFFLYLAFSLLGLYDLYTPSFFNRDAAVGQKKSILNCFLLGLVSGTVASPCLTPVLALLLGIVAKQQAPILGFLTLFSFAFGMGTLLMLAGTFAGALSVLPRAGEWMNAIKNLLGFIMIGMCGYFAKPFFPAWGIMAFNISLLAIASLFFFLSKPSSLLRRIIGVTCLAGAIAMLWTLLR